MGHSWISQAASVFLVLTCAYAWLKGAPAERQGAIVLLICNLAGDMILALTFPHPPGVLMLGADFVLAAALLGLAILHSSLWLGAAMLLQSVALCIHAFVLGGDGPQPVQFIIANNIISQLMLVCIIVATTLSWLARSRRSQVAPAAIQPA